MVSKVCTKCQQKKSAIDFNISKVAKDYMEKALGYLKLFKGDKQYG